MPHVTRAGQRQALGQGVEAAAELDLIGLQETTYELASGIANALQWPPPHYVETDQPPRCGYFPFPTVQECTPYGNAILSSYPLANTTDWELTAASGEGYMTRKLLRASVVIPSGEEVFFYTTHIASDDGSTLDERTGQIEEVRAHVQFDAAGRSGFRAVVAGDFNSRPGDPGIYSMVGNYFVDAWVYAHGNEAGLTGCLAADPANPDAPKTARCRIDYVFLWKEAGLIASQADVFGVSYVAEDDSVRYLSDHNYLVVEVK